MIWKRHTGVLGEAPSSKAASPGSHEQASILIETMAEGLARCRAKQSKT
jgi:hypothetical protein